MRFFLLLAYLYIELFNGNTLRPNTVNNGDRNDDDDDDDVSIYKNA